MVQCSSSPVARALRPTPTGKGISEEGRSLPVPATRDECLAHQQVPNTCQWVLVFEARAVFEFFRSNRIRGDGPSRLHTAGFSC